MASIRELKKDINYVLGDIIGEVQDWEAETGNYGSDEGSALIDKTIEVFDTLMNKVHEKEVENAKAHFDSIRKELVSSALSLTEEINKLS